MDYFCNRSWCTTFYLKGNLRNNVLSGDLDLFSNNVSSLRLQSKAYFGKKTSCYAVCQMCSY